MPRVHIGQDGIVRIDYRAHDRVTLGVVEHAYEKQLAVSQEKQRPFGRPGGVSTMTAVFGRIQRSRTWTDATQNPIAASYSERKARTLCLGDGVVEFHEVDRHAGLECLPMDVFVHSKTMRRHFQGSSIRARWTGTHAATG